MNIELIYRNKKTEVEIIEQSTLVSKKLKYPIQIENNKNLFFLGDNFNSLSYLLNNGYKESIDLIYIDPPYNTNQTFTVSSNEQHATTISREQVNDFKIAYEDKFVLENYFEFIRERLILLRELLSEKGSIYLHIDTKMGHYIKILMDEVFGINNFKNDISRIKSNPKNFGRKAFGNEKDLVLFYSKNYDKNIFNNITIPLSEDEKLKMFSKVDADGRSYNTVPVHAPGETRDGPTGREWKGMIPPKGRHWRVAPSELDKLDKANLIEWSKTGNPRIKKYADEHKGKKIQDIWLYKDPTKPLYPTEKNAEMLKMIILQSSNENSIVLDCFAGSGSTLKVAAQLNRKWIGMDSSTVAFNTCLKNLKNETFDIFNV